MSGIRDLYELQSLDSALDLTRERLNQIMYSLGRDEDILLLKQELLRLHDRYREVLEAHDKLDIGVSEFNTRINQVELKMYSGTVVNPRELEDLQADMEQIRRQKLVVEEQLLSLLEQLEELKVEMGNIENTLDMQEKRWEADQADLLGEKVTLDESVKVLSEHRESLAITISPIELTLYNQVRARHRGRAVAKVERDTCGSCRTGIPNSQIQALRSDVTPVRCDNCGLILFRE